MKKHIILIILLYAGLITNAGEKLLLQDCYTMAEENYPLINHKSLIDKMDEYKQLQLKRKFLPLINLNLQASYQSDVTNLPIDLSAIPNVNLNMEEIAKDQYKAALDIQQLIWDGGMIREQKKVDKLDTKISHQNLKVELYKIKDQVNQLFFNCLLLEKQINVLKLSKANIENNIQKLNELIKQGMALQADLDALMAEKISIIQNISELTYNRKAGIDMLAFIIAKEIKPDQEFEYHESFLKTTNNQIDRPEIESFMLEQQKQSAKIEILEASKLPQISGNGQFGYGRPALNMLSNDFETYYKMSLNLRWNLWDWNKRNTDKDMLKINASMIDYKRKTFEHNIWVKHKQNYAEIAKLDSFMDQDKAIIKLRTNIRESAESKLENGVLTSSDYLTELNKETQSRLNFEYHKIQLALAKINLKYLLGQL